MESVKDDIVDVLHGKQNIARQYYLLLGLTEIVSVDEFNQLTQDIEIYPLNKRRIQPVLEFKAANDEQRLVLAEASLSKDNAVFKRESVDYLIKADKPEALLKHWNNNDGLVKPAIRRAGFVIEVKDEKAFFKRTQPEHNSLWNIRAIIFGLALILITLVWMAYKRVKTKKMRLANS
jgi:hypothetical protein